ncbi:MAG: alpha-ketoacid dehydrogenase subunit beta [Chloroflexi bacterium]|nr:alpha-ketoacid dehydrogenase subunit beta [Chloroflexota bacterium]
MKNMMYGQAVNEGMCEEMARDQNVLLMGLDVEKMGGAFGQTAGLYDQFGPQRVVNMPISESGYTGAGVGLAMMGKRPIVELQFADFGAYAFDSIANQAAKTRYMSGGQWSVPMVIRAVQGAGFGAGAQHSQCIEGWFQNVPGLKIVAPSTPADAKGLMKMAVRDNDPVLYLEHKALLGIKGDVPDGDYTVPLGQAWVAREGKDVTIISYQLMLYRCLEAAAELEKEGISVEVIDPRTLLPLDRETITASVQKTGRALIVHEHPTRGGFGGEIAAVINEDCFGMLKSPVRRLGAVNAPLPFGGAEQYSLPNKDSIMQMVKGLL